MRHAHPRLRSLLALALVVPVVATGLVACSRDKGPTPVLQAFLEGWAKGDLAGVPLEDPSGTTLAPADVLAEIDALAGPLDERRWHAQPTADPPVDADRARATVNVEWTVVDGLVWPYQTTVELHRVDGQWRVVFTPATVHPTLTAGDELVVSAIPAPRGSIVDGADQAIVTARPVVIVGIEPQRVTNQAALLAELDAAFDSLGLDIDLSDLPDQLAAANPDAFVTVVTLRREAYDQIRDRIHPLPGTVFREDTLQLAPTRTFARALLGTVGEVTREQLDTHPGRYLVGEQVGQSGLQAQFDDRLRGTPGVEIRYRRGGSVSEEVLYRAEPVPGEALRTTLDQRVQLAADAALAGQARPSALVAVRISDGAILAAANGPDGGTLNLAFTASVPPGSTFKMVSALGLLGSGEVTADSPVECPGTFTVDGRTFTNSDGFSLGTVPFRTAFAHSCNTTFAALAPRLGPDGLRRAAASVGIGTAWDIGTPVVTGSVGANQSTVEAAAAAFGQGTTLVSPLSLAAAAAAVARGSWVTPKLFPDGAPPTEGDGSTEGSAQGDPPPADGTALPTAAVAALQVMMREVVTAGTATALADVPGGPVYVKTGTAEFNDNPADTHAWTIGWQGDIAFAVFVENGGGSGETAVPIVEAFLRGLA
ncbi:MAG: penicillin-binding protein [Micromonosporaceae bacterium]|nr:penicillin-binding protein [Micromonosporaceae bacterium]